MITLGGDAELELVDSLDPFSEGIVFSVRPPKKSWKNIANLSGGEKTLSSLALVFALHHFKVGRAPTRGGPDRFNQIARGGIRFRIGIGVGIEIGVGVRIGIEVGIGIGIEVGVGVGVGIGVGDGLVEEDSAVPGVFVERFFGRLLARSLASSRGWEALDAEAGLSRPPWCSLLLSLSLFSYRCAADPAVRDGRDRRGA